MSRKFSRFRGLIFATLIVGCTKTVSSSGERLVERTFASMGSELRLTAWTADESAANAAFEAVSQEFERLEGLMSTWREHSEVQSLNTAAGKHPVPVGTELRDVLQVAHRVSEW